MRSSPLSIFFNIDTRASARRSATGNPANSGAFFYCYVIFFHVIFIMEPARVLLGGCCLYHMRRKFLKVSAQVHSLQ